jgi:hypothetical protein
MKYETGYRSGRIPVGSGGSGGIGEQLLFGLGVFAVGVVLALTLFGAGETRRIKAEEECAPLPDAVAVMSRAAETEAEADLPVPAGAGEDGEQSVYDEIGAFFARLLFGAGDAWGR